MAITEFEYCVLGVVGQEGPLSAYAVRRRFEQSLSESWSASAGAVYPAIRRLSADGLIAAAQPAGGRKARLLALTATGAAELRRWLVELDDDAGRVTSHPIRSRFNYFTLLTPPERAQLVAAALLQTERALAAAEQRYDVLTQGAGEPPGAVALLGAIYELRGRREWLRRLAAA